MTPRFIQLATVLYLSCRVVSDSCPDLFPSPATSGPSSCGCEYRSGVLNLIRCSRLSAWPTTTSESVTTLVIDDLTRMQNRNLNSNILGNIVPNLESFQCNECGVTGIKSLAFFGMRHLRQLSLEENNITVVSKNAFLGLSNMTTLSLKNSKVVTIEPKAFFNVRHIERLDLSYNPLTDIQPGAFSDLSNVNQLNLNRISTNVLKSYSLQGLKNVTLLSFVFSEIRSIEPYAFFGIDNIDIISFTSSQVSDLQPLSFVGIGQVTTITFKDSKVSTLECDVLLNGLNCVRNMIWEDIPLRCDCNLQWIVEMSPNISRDLTQTLRCASPLDFRGRVPMDLGREDLECNEAQRYAGCAPLDTRVPRVRPLERFIEANLGNKYSYSHTARTTAFKLLLVPLATIKFWV